MKNKLLAIAILTFTITISSKAQINMENIGSEISFGKGVSLYNNIQTNQWIVFIKIPELSGNLGNVTCTSNINFEYINENNTITYLIGFVPMFRYDINFLNTNLFLMGGIGANYISHGRIGTRNLGGHFIFSDMLSIGSDLIHIKNISIEISFLFRHVSNAGIYHSNEGFNSKYIVFSVII